MKPYNKEESKKIQIRRMFNNIAPYYDAICHLLSFNIDKLWRKKLVRLVAQKSPIQIVDIATGTGDVAISLATHIRNSRITGVDISEQMLKIAQKKIARLPITNIELLCEDAESMSLADSSFDAATISFGIRNFENIDKGLLECHRILKQGGDLFIMEFSTPRNRVFNTLYRGYSRGVMPIIGRSISRDGKAYQYLPQSITEFHTRSQFIGLLQDSGFTNCTCYCLSNGIAYIYVGTKAE